MCHGARKFHVPRTWKRNIHVYNSDFIWEIFSQWRVGYPFLVLWAGGAWFQRQLWDAATALGPEEPVRRSHRLIVG